MSETKGNKRAFVAGVHLKSQSLAETQASMAELRALAETLGLTLVGSYLQQRDAIDSRSFLGRGKLEEIKAETERLEADLILLDAELSPNQAKVIEQTLGRMVLDRSQVILEIFSNHARSPESKAQVELARLHYMLPRLVGMWAHLDREKGGIGASKGTGEKQINIDRALVRSRMRKLEKDLKRIEGQRAVQAKQRKNHFTVGLVGYTNAGKTSLLKALTGKGEGGEDQLFATLESTTRKLYGLTKPEILLSDTVGFIQRLPHHLVASFRSTLSVVREADLLLHVVDAGSPMLNRQTETTLAVLDEIGAGQIPRMTVMSKVDLIPDPVEEIILKKSFPKAVFVSTLNPKSIEPLKLAIQHYFLEGFIHEIFKVPYTKSGLLPQIYQLAMVEEVAYEEDTINLTLAVTSKNRGILAKALEQYNGEPL